MVIVAVTEIPMDFKRLNEGNTGENTGSMGCVSYKMDFPTINKDDIEVVKKINTGVVKTITNTLNH